MVFVNLDVFDALNTNLISRKLLQFLQKNSES